MFIFINDVAKIYSFKPIIMKKTISVFMVAAGMMLSASVFAQDHSYVRSQATQVAIEKSPSLQKADLQLKKYEGKIEGREGEYKNSSADKKALLTKFIALLEEEISANASNAEVVNALQAELTARKAELKSMK